MESEFPTLVKFDASVVCVPNTNSDWLRAIPDVLGVVIIEFAGFIGITDSCEEGDVIEKEEFITDGHSDSCLSSNENLNQSNFIIDVCQS